jgi:cytochrome c-type biogenesis protein CcmE
MKRSHQLVLGGVVIVVLIGVVSTSMGSTTPKVSPSELESGAYDGEYVSVEGRASNVQFGDSVRLTIVGNVSDASVPVVVQSDSTPATLQSGELVIAKGVYEDGTLEASEILVRSHEE